MKGQVGFALAALAMILLSASVSRRTRLPSAVLLVLVGIVYGELPGPNIELRPAVVLTLVLPPLLYSTALQASLVEIRAHARVVVSLSVGLPLATTFAVAGLFVLVVPDLPFALAVALGAAVAPPDPVASLAIGRRAGLPARLTTLIEGEGLLNDATALTTYQVAVAAAVGSGVTAFSAVGTFVLEALGGVAIGYLIAVIVRQVRRWISDPLVDNGLSLGIPFACYLAGEAAHSSGVLAVVIAGLVLGHTSSGETSGPSRLQTRAVWRLLDFLLEGFVFLLIGQQFPSVLRGLDAYSVSTLTAAAAVTLGAVLAVRPIWLLGMAIVPARLRGPGRPLRRRETVAMSWAGTRGVITLAAAFALPLTAHGAPLPRRDLLLFCAYLVVLATLVGQGLTFGPLVKALGLPVGEAQERRTRIQARLAASHAGMEQLERVFTDDEVPEHIADRMRARVAAQIDRQQHAVDHLESAGELDLGPVVGELARLRLLYIDAQREELSRWRDAGRLSDRSLRELDRELDVEETRGPG